MTHALQSLWQATQLVEKHALDELQAMLAADSTLIDSPTNGHAGSRKLLHLAAGCGNLPACQLLIGLGNQANDAAPKEAYTTPLMEAAGNGHVAVMAFLLAQGAHVDGDPRSPSNPLLNAVRYGHHGAVQLLLDHGCDVNRLHDNLSQTAFDLAKIWQHPGIADSLAQQGGVPARGANGD